MERAAVGGDRPSKRSEREAQEEWRREKIGAAALPAEDIKEEETEEETEVEDEAEEAAGGAEAHARGEGEEVERD